MPTYERAAREKMGLVSPRCSAHRHDGKPCAAYAIRGGSVCRVHGGGSPQVRAAARRRIEAVVDAAARRLCGFAFDDGVPDNIALAAVNGILDRAGLNAKTAVSVEVGTASST